MPPETILNLWYLVDENQQFIVGIAGRAYIADGNDDEKIALLRQLATTDFSLALRLPVPSRYTVDYLGEKLTGIASVVELDNPATQLFEELYQAIDAELVEKASAFNLSTDAYKIPDNPLCKRGQSLFCSSSPKTYQPMRPQYPVAEALHGRGHFFM